MTDACVCVREREGEKEKRMWERVWYSTTIFRHSWTWHSILVRQLYSVPAGSSIETPEYSPVNRSFVETKRSGTGNVSCAKTWTNPRVSRPINFLLTDLMDTLGSVGRANSKPGWHCNVNWLPDESWEAGKRIEQTKTSQRYLQTEYYDTLCAGTSTVEPIKRTWESGRRL